jgi:hypothetical protein
MENFKEGMGRSKGTSRGLRLNERRDWRGRGISLFCVTIAKFLKLGTLYRK